MATTPVPIPEVGTPPDYPVRAGTTDKAAYLAQVAAADARFPVYTDELNAATAALNAAAVVTYSNAQAAAQSAADAEGFVDTAAQQVEAAVESTLAQAQGLAGQAANSAADAASFAQAAQASANFAGDWSEQSGAASVPLTVYHNSQFWTLLQDVSNISAHVPSDSSTIWARVQSVDIIRTPVLITPLSGATGVNPTPTLEADGYANIYGFARDYREFQVDLSTGDFSTPLWSEQVDADTAVVGTALAFNTGHKWRCRDVAVDGTTGRWSSVAVFSTGAVSIARPTLTVDGAPDDVGETPTLTTSAFSVIGGTDTHLNTDWQVLDDQLAVIWESMADAANKLSIVVPADILQESSTYTFRVRHRGAVYGVSPWRSVIATTREEFFVFDPSSAGLPFGGGFYAGANIIVDGQEYALVVAPRSQGGLSATTLRWKTADTSTSGTDRLNDGLANSNAMNNSTHPAAQFCRGLNINGHNDWYLPSRDELEICYRYLKPTTTATTTSTNNPDGAGVNNNSNPLGTAYTSDDPVQTSISIFQGGGGEAFILNLSPAYWSSTQFSSGNAWRHIFSNGDQGFSSKSDTLSVRAVRKVAI